MPLWLGTSRSLEKGMKLGSRKRRLPSEDSPMAELIKHLQSPSSELGAMAGDPTKPPETPPSGEEGATMQRGVAKMPNAVFAGRGSWVGKQKWHPRETSPKQPKGQRFSCRSFGDMALGVEPFQPLLQKMSHDGPPVPQGTLHK